VSMIETIKVVKDNAAGYCIINKSDFDPRRHEEYNPDADSDKAPLVERALELEVLGPNGKPAAKTVLARWSIDRLKTAIAEAEGKE
jgi:hypothetical protein